MKKLYNFNIGDVVDDLELVEIISPIKGSGQPTKYRVMCQKCGREKVLTGPLLAKHIGTSHSACGKGIKLKDKDFYNHWCAMRTRTTNPNQKNWEYYGGRGITSDEFANFVDFYDALYTSYLTACEKFGKPNVTLERVDVDGNYSRDNCIWIHQADQKDNQRKTVYFEIEFPDGHKEIGKNVRKFAREHDINYNCLVDVLNGRLKSYKGYKGYRIKRESVTTKLG